jgi:prepilin-type N-terminal cleavage/methylation domain-containing protein
MTYKTCKAENTQHGYSLIEMSIVMLLLVLFGLGIFMLAASTTTTYESLVENKAEGEAIRIASSYIVTKIRQNDKIDSIKIDSKTFDDRDALIVLETINDETYETWIYVSEGYLREVTVLKGIMPNDDLSFEIAEIDRLTLSGSDHSLVIGIKKGEKDLKDILVTLKSEVETIK